MEMIVMRGSTRSAYIHVFTRVNPNRFVGYNSNTLTYIGKSRIFKPATEKLTRP